MRTPGALYNNTRPNVSYSAHPQYGHTAIAMQRPHQSVHGTWPGSPSPGTPGSYYAAYERSKLQTAQTASSSPLSGSNIAHGGPRISASASSHYGYGLPYTHASTSPSHMYQVSSTSNPAKQVPAKKPRPEVEYKVLEFLEPLTRASFESRLTKSAEDTGKANSGTATRLLPRRSCKGEGRSRGRIDSSPETHDADADTDNDHSRASDDDGPPAAWGSAHPRWRLRFTARWKSSDRGVESD
jgi:hypothetical protein